MTTLGCGQDCVPFTWDFAKLHVGGGLALWFLLLIASYVLYSSTFTSNTERARINAGLLKRRLDFNPLFIVLHGGFALAQCSIFCYRSIFKEEGAFSMIIEFVAFAFYFAEQLASWSLAWLTDWSTGHLYHFTWGLTNCMLFASVCLLPIPVNGEKSYGSFSFLAFLYLVKSWRCLNAGLRVFLVSPKWRINSLLVEGLMLLFLLGSAMLTVEQLGDPPELASLSRGGEWNTVSAIYFVFMSVATVGPGDIVASTFFGRYTSILAVGGGIALMGSAVQQVATVVTRLSSGRGTFRPGIRTRAIIISGNPSAAMLEDFIREIFHPDHAADAEDLHLILLFPSDGSEMEASQRNLRKKEMVKLTGKISIFQGSMLDVDDLNRISALRAIAFYVLPNLNCPDPYQEDAENIIRMLALRRYIPTARVTLLLLKADSRHILEDAGLKSVSATEKAGLGDAGEAAPELTIFAVDQFKLELIGKSMDVLGFAPFICNLCKSVGHSVDEHSKTKPEWWKTYMEGVSIELYEIELSSVYSENLKAEFAEVVTDVLEHTDGKVFLIGIVELTERDAVKTVLVNPGPHYRIKKTSSGIRSFGIFLAEDRECVVQTEGNMIFLGRPERPNEPMLRTVAASEEDESAPITLPAPGLRPGRDEGRGASKLRSKLSTGEKAMVKLVGPVLNQRAKHLTLLAKMNMAGQQPTRPPLLTIASGGHILFLCVGADHETDLRLSVHHFVRPLREGKMQKNMVPIIVMCPMVPRDWDTVCNYHAVYFLQGSPLSQLDLERANFRSASSIFICNVACGGVLDAGALNAAPIETAMVDSETICCSRLVESQLPVGMQALIVADIRDGGNHFFLPVPPTSNTGSSIVQSIGLFDNWDGPPPSRPNTIGRIVAKGRKSFRSMSKLSDMEGSTSEEGPGALIRKSKTFISEAAQNTNRMMESFKSEGSVLHISERDAVGGQAAEEAGEAAYYQQPRFASSQLYVGSSLTSLVANSFYNPSMADLMKFMVTAEVSSEKVPAKFVGKTYREIFDHLMFVEERIAVAILRRADPRHLGSGGAEMGNRSGMKRAVSRMFPVSEQPSEMPSMMGATEGGESEADAPKMMPTKSNFSARRLKSKSGVSEEAASKRRFAYLITAPSAEETVMLESDFVISFAKSHKARDVRSLSKQKHDQEQYTSQSQGQSPAP